MSYSISFTDVSRGVYEKVQEQLTFIPKTYNTKFNRGAIPTPISLYRIIDNRLHLPYLYAASLFQIIPNIDINYPTTNVEFTGTLRPEQITVESESWQQLQMYGTSTLGLYPGFGKTILGARLSTRTNLLTVILVHREILTSQWKTTYNKVTNADVWIVGEKHPPARCNVIICMDTRWHHIPKAMRDNIGFLIIDEAHVFCTPSHVECLLAFHPKYILLESATLEREEDGMETMMYAIAGAHGVFRDTSKPFKVIKVITNTITPRKQTRTGDINYTALVHDTLYDPRRNQIIFNLVAANAKFKILILTSLVEHAQYLSNTINTMGITSDYMCGSKKTYNDGNVLVGTLSKLGTGFDQDAFCAEYDGRKFNLLLLVCSIRKNALLVQNVGRCFRSDFPTIMHFVDSDSIFANHWSRCVRWYIKHNGEVSEYSIPNAAAPQLSSTTTKTTKTTKKNKTTSTPSSTSSSTSSSAISDFQRQQMCISAQVSQLATISK